MKLKAYTQKDRFGNSVSLEFFEDNSIPSMQAIPMYDHPGDPKGTDTVPAWLTPGEYVMNAESVRMFEPQIEAMNNAGKEVQRVQGGSIPEYKADGGLLSDIGNSIGELYDKATMPQSPSPGITLRKMPDGRWGQWAGNTFRGYYEEPEKTSSRRENTWDFSLFQNEGGPIDYKNVLSQFMMQDDIEGFKSDPYQDPTGIWTQGYGTTGGITQGSESMSQEQAQERLMKDIGEVDNAYNNLVKVDLNPYQKSAVQSLMYNVGSGRFGESEALKKLNEGDFDGYLKEAGEFRLAGGEQLPGLVSRRNKEAELFRTAYSAEPAQQVAEPGVLAKLGIVTPAVAGTMDSPPPKPDDNEGFFSKLFSGGTDANTMPIPSEDGSDIPPPAPQAAENAAKTADSSNSGTTGNQAPGEVPPFGLGVPDQIGPRSEDQEIRDASMLGKDIPKEEEPKVDPGLAKAAAEAEAQQLADKRQEAKDLLKKRQAESKMVPNLGGSGIVIQDIDDVVAAKEKNAETATNNLINAAQTGDPDLITAAAGQVDEAAVGTGAARITQSGMTAQADQSRADSAAAAAKKNDQEVANLRAQAEAQAQAGNQTAANTLSAAADEKEKNGEGLHSTAEDAQTKADASNSKYDAEREAGAAATGGKLPAGTTKENVNKEAAKKNTIEKIAAKAKGQTGPAKDQAGDNSDSKSVEQTGEKQSPENKKQAEGWLSGLFGDLFDKKELARMAVMYLGSRALGYSHGGSLEFAAKNYVTRVDNAVANRQKFVEKNVDKFTTESLELYQRSGKLSDLERVGAAKERTGEYKEFYGKGKNGKTITVKAEKVKVGKNTYWVDPAGNRIDGSRYNVNPQQVKGTKEYNEYVDKTTGRYTDQLKELQTKFGKMGEGKDGRTLYRTDVSPVTEGRKIAEWAVKHGKDPSQMGGLVELAMKDAQNDQRQDGKRVSTIVPYLNSLVIREKSGNPDMFMIEDPNDDEKKVPVDALKFQELNDDIVVMMSQVGIVGDEFNVTNQYYNEAMKEYGGLPDDEIEQYQRLAKDQNISPFMAYVQQDLAAYASTLANQ